MGCEWYIVQDVGTVQALHMNSDNNTRMGCAHIEGIQRSSIGEAEGMQSVCRGCRWRASNGKWNAHKGCNG